MKKLLYLILPIFLFSSCDEDEITLTARDATNVTSSTAEITIQLEADEDQEFDETGLLYSKRRNDVENGAGIECISSRLRSGSYMVRLYELEPETRYYYCGYARINNDYYYSDIESFKTKELKQSTQK